MRAVRLFLPARAVIKLVLQAASTVNCGLPVLDTVDRGLAVNYARIPDCACLDVRILGPKRNLDHRPFFSLGRYVNEFIQIIFLFEQSLFRLRCETVVGIVLCYNHQVCCFLYYLCEINNGIHIYQFTFELLHFCFRM